MLLFKKFGKYRHFFIAFLPLLLLELVVSAKKLGVIRLASFGAVNFDRIPGYALVNATYLTIENLKLFSCISKCKGNKACLSLNFRKKSDSETICELNDDYRFTASELAFQKQPDSQHFEIQSPCKKTVCHNGGLCHFNQMEGTHQCRCPLEFSGEQCEAKNVYADKFNKVHGIVNGELFLVGPQLNHAEAATVCQSFGAEMPVKQDIIRIASEAKDKVCTGAWTKSGGRGYPEYNGNCHSGSTYTGYFNNACCLDKVATKTNGWCIRKNIDYCKPGWYAFKKWCLLLRDDDKVNRNKAIDECARKSASLASFSKESFRTFLNRICSSCSSMYLRAMKVENEWKSHGKIYNTDTLWAANEPSGLHTCMAWDFKADGIKAVSCDALLGYACSYTPFSV